MFPIINTGANAFAKKHKCIWHMKLNVICTVHVCMYYVRNTMGFGLSDHHGCSMFVQIYLHCDNLIIPTAVYMHMGVL